MSGVVVAVETLLYDRRRRRKKIRRISRTVLPSVVNASGRRRHCSPISRLNVKRGRNLEAKAEAKNNYEKVPNND